jgi:hypothetical protein
MMAALTMLNTVVVSPIPSANVMTAMSDKVGFLINIRTPYRKSCSRLAIWVLHAGRGLAGSSTRGAGSGNDAS